MNKTTNQTNIYTPSTTTPYKQSYYEPCCPYKDDCIDRGIKCSSCRHNKKRSYYEPNIPYTPFPERPYTPIITWGTIPGGYKWG